MNLYQLIGTLERLIEEKKIQAAQEVFEENKDNVPENIKSMFSTVLFERDMHVSALVKQNSSRDEKEVKDRFNSLFQRRNL